MGDYAKARKPMDGRMCIPIACFTLFVLLACSRLFVSPDGSHSVMLLPEQGTLRELPRAVSKQPASAPEEQQQQQQQPSEWDSHIIFNGAKGGLHDCPDSSSWLADQWLGAAASGASDDDAAAAAAGGGAGGGWMLPHSAEVQQAIWEHQNPEDCAAARYLLYSNPALGEGSHGVGSLLHLETTALLLALNTGRVLVEVPGTYLTDHPYCSNRSAATLDSCYFVPLSGCTVTPEQVQDATFLNAKRPADVAALLADSASNATLPRFVRTNRLLAMKNPLVHSVPAAFKGLVDASGIPRKNAYYWWRAQAVAYIVRPNAETLAQIALRKRDKLRGLPLAPGCVSVYIRHGDKGSEHKTFEDSEYEAALEHLRAVDPSLTRQVFLSTEDPQTVVFFTNATRNWATSYVDMPRKPNRKKNNIVYMKEHGFAEEMLDGLLNLDLALACDGFVSSINSNWARLIDELRSTTRCKAGAKYMDVGLRSPKGFFFWY